MRLSTWLSANYCVIDDTLLFVQCESSHVNHIVTKINLRLVNRISLDLHPIDLYQEIVWQLLDLYSLFLHALMASFT